MMLAAHARGVFIQMQGLPASHVTKKGCARNAIDMDNALCALKGIGLTTGNACCARVQEKGASHVGKIINAPHALMATTSMIRRYAKDAMKQ